MCPGAAVLTRPLCFQRSRSPGPVTVTLEFGSVPSERPEDRVGRLNSSIRFTLQTAIRKDEATSENSPHWPAGGLAAGLPPSLPAQPAGMKAAPGDRSLWRTLCWGDSASSSPALLDSSWDGPSCLDYSAVVLIWTKVLPAEGSWYCLTMSACPAPSCQLPPSHIDIRHVFFFIQPKLIIILLILCLLGQQVPIRGSFGTGLHIKNKKLILLCKKPLGLLIKH